MDATFRVFRDCGRARDECVVYWTAPVAFTVTINGHDHPDHRRSPGGYEIESAWLTRYWFQLARERRTIRAQLHTHPGGAFHSGTDDHWPVVSQPGFLSIVIPDFATGPVSLERAWVGLLDEGGRWCRVGAEAVIELTP